MKTIIHTERSKRNRTRGLGRVLSGTVLALTGLFWLGKNAGLAPIAMGGGRLVWPVLAIALGAIMVFREGSR
jgi:hypothetical protein